MIYQTEKVIKDNADKVPADIKSSVEAKIEDLKKVKDTEDTEAIKKALEAVTAEAQKIGQAMYAAAGAQNQANPNQTAGETPNQSEEAKAGPQEAEYEEVKKEENPQA